MTTHLPRVGSIELHTTYVLVRDGAGAVLGRVDVELMYEPHPTVWCDALIRERFGADARRGSGTVRGWTATYDVHAPVRAERDGARMEA